MACKFKDYMERKKCRMFCLLILCWLLDIYMLFLNTHRAENEENKCACVSKRHEKNSHEKKIKHLHLPYKFVRVWCCLKCNCATIHFPASNRNVFYNLLFFTYCRPTTRQTYDFFIASSNGNYPMLYRIHIGNVAKCIDLCLWKHAVFVVVVDVVVVFFLFLTSPSSPSLPFHSSFISNHPSTRAVSSVSFSLSRRSAAIL